MYLPIPNQNYTKYANYGFGGTPTGFQTRDYATGIDSPLVQPGEFRTPEEVLGDEPTQSFKAVEMNTGGLASIAKFNEGGMGQVLPSKMTHDENDANNYDRANGFVMDGTGHGKDHEDTMLAQLADGEFVSRSHAVLGAGIIAGASPSDKSDQRKKGAKFFYDQQKQFKRIFDLINANKNRTDSTCFTKQEIEISMACTASRISAQSVYQSGRICNCGSILKNMVNKDHMQLWVVITETNEVLCVCVTEIRR
jgi:hypothetical protein